MSNNYKKFQIINIIAILFTIAINALSNILLFGGVNTGEAADRFFSYFTPAGYVFSIWSIIYTLQIIFIVYQARSNQVDEEYLGKIGYLYLISGFFNVTWLIAFHFAVDTPILLLLTEPLMLGILVTLLYTYVRLGVGVSEVPLSQKIAVHLPVSVYVGWISVATIANTASVLNEFLTGVGLHFHGEVVESEQGSAFIRAHRSSLSMVANCCPSLMAVRPAATYTAPTHMKAWAPHLPSCSIPQLSHSPRSTS